MNRILGNRMSIKKLFIFVSATMLAFAANSLVTRIAISNEHLGPSSFAFVRLLTGVLVIFFIVARSFGAKALFKSRPKFDAVLGLTCYMIGFHHAYVFIDAGLGALILFGGVQIVMFSAAVLSNDNPGKFTWLGMLVALSGMFLLFQPFSLDRSQPIWGLFLMMLAALGWGIYSLSGTDAHSPTERTMANFLYTLPIVTVVFVFYPDDFSGDIFGIFLASLSGGITTALGYSLWYYLIPFLRRTTSSLVQLSVPVIALILGVLVLDERITYESIIAAILIISGIALGTLFGTERNRI